MSALARIQALEVAARRNKSAVHFHRARLRQCMAELEHLRSLAARMNVLFTTNRINGVEENSWPGAR